MCGDAQDSICSCKQLRMLYISTGLVPGLCCSTGDAVSTFCEQLPQLRTLQWRMATYGPERPNHFSPAFVARVASHATIGLQLLQVRLGLFHCAWAFLMLQRGNAAPRLHASLCGSCLRTEHCM